jgi:hypothetical protein
MAFKVRFPFCAMLSGPSQAGKTFFMKLFLEKIDLLIDAKIEEVIWCYGISQSAHDDIKKICPVPIRFHEGVPDIDEITTTTSGPKVVVLDDLMRQASSGDAVDLFTRGSHHRSLGIFNLVQNFFCKGQRDISLNCHYIIFFNNPRDKQQISQLARQMAPHKWRYILDAYIDATSVAHGYLLLDLMQQTRADRRVRTNIFPGEQQYAYVPK